MLDQDIQQVKVLVYGVMLDIPVPFPIDQPDACKDPDSGVQCPVHKDQEYHYTTMMLVQKKFPSVITHTNISIFVNFSRGNGL